MKLLIHFQTSTVRWSLEMGTVISSHTYNGCDLSSILGLTLIHVSKRGPWWRLCAESSSGKVNTAFGSGILHKIYCRLNLQLGGGHIAVDFAIKCRALSLLHFLGNIATGSSAALMYCMPWSWGDLFIYRFLVLHLGIRCRKICRNGSD